MKYENVRFDERCVNGLSIRTTNGENRFFEVWGEFFKSYGGGQIAAVYTDYESDYRGEFLFVVGIVGDTAENSIRIPTGDYVKFHLDTREDVPNCWQEIWKSDINRAYRTDFELYGEDGSVDIYISVK